EERVPNRVAVGRVLAGCEGRRLQIEEERGMANIAPVLVQGDVLKNLIEVPAPTAADHRPACAQDVVREPEPRADVVLIELALGCIAARGQGAERRRLERVCVRAGLD